MKPKIFSKKLALNKNTVSDLSKKDMENVNGGETGITCGDCDSNISCYLDYRCLVCPSDYPQFCGP